MDLVATDLQRVFRFSDEQQQKITLDDPDPEMEVNDVMRYYGPFYPLLTISIVKGPVIEDDNLIYEFIPLIGTKG